MVDYFRSYSREQVDEGLVRDRVRITEEMG